MFVYIRWLFIEFVMRFMIDEPYLICIIIKNRVTWFIAYILFYLYVFMLVGPLISKIFASSLIDQYNVKIDKIMDCLSLKCSFK